MGMVPGLAFANVDTVQSNLNECQHAPIKAGLLTTSVHDETVTNMAGTHCVPPRCGPSATRRLNGVPQSRQEACQSHRRWFQARPSPAAVGRRNKTHVKLKDSPYNEGLVCAA